MYNIYNNRHKLLAKNLPKTRTNIYNINKIKQKFENDMKSEVQKLEGKMKIGYSTLRSLAKKLRLKKYNDCEKLKNMKFSKPYLQKFVRTNEITFTRRKSNQTKFSKEELIELRKPINELLSEFPINRVINMDESGLPLNQSHQKGTFTCETDMKDFKDCVQERFQMNQFLSWFMIRLNSKNFRIFYPSESILKSQSSVCRAFKNILIDTKIATLAWGSKMRVQFYRVFTIPNPGIQPIYDS